METPDHAIEAKKTRLVLLSKEFMRAALVGDRDGCRSLLKASFPPEWPDEDGVFLLETRIKDLEDDPERGVWLLRAMVDREVNQVVGHIGFHGAPDARGFVEVGYEVFPDHRRKGYAEDAVRALLDWAATKPRVRGFRASAGPANDPSLALIRKLGFRQIGVQWDERDGLELVFELFPVARRQAGE